MKQITLSEAEKIIYEVGHQANISIKMNDQHEEFERTILNNSCLWNAHGKSIGSRDNKYNAQKALKFITTYGKNKFRIYSSYFNWATNDYEII